MSGGRVPPVATLLVLESRPRPRGGEATCERRGRAGFVHSPLCKAVDDGVWAAGFSWNHGQRTGGRTVALVELKAWLEENTICHAGWRRAWGASRPSCAPPPPPDDETASCFGQFGSPTIEANQRSPLCMQPCRATRRGRRGRWAPSRALVRSSSTRAQWFCGETLPAAVHRRGPAVCNSASRPARTDGRGAASGSSRYGRASAPHRHRRAGRQGSSVRCCLPAFLAGGGSVQLFLAAPAPPRTVRGGQLVVEILFVWQGRSGTALPGLPPPSPSRRLLLRRRFQGLYRFPPRPTGRASKRAGPPPRLGARVWTNHGMERPVT